MKLIEIIKIYIKTPKKKVKNSIFHRYKYKNNIILD